MALRATRPSYDGVKDYFASVGVSGSPLMASYRRKYQALVPADDRESPEFRKDMSKSLKGKLLACVKNAGAGTCVSHKSMARADEQRQKVLTQLRRRDIKRDVRTKTGFREGEDHVEDDGLNRADQYNDYDEPLSSKRKVHLLCSCSVPLLLLCVFVV